MKILIAVAIILCGFGLVVASHSLQQITLTAEEVAKINASCAKCHANLDDLGENNAPEDAGAAAVHRIHANASCVTCHSGTPGLAGATKANDALQWAGIGIVAVTLAGLVLNFIVARKRLVKRETGNGRPNN